MEPASLIAAAAPSATAEPAASPASEPAPEPLPEILPEIQPEPLPDAAVAEPTLTPKPAMPAQPAPAPARPARPPVRPAHPAGPFRPGPAVGPSAAALAARSGAPALVTNANTAGQSYRPKGYPIGGMPKPPHVLASFICTVLLLTLAYFVLRELAQPSHPPAAERGGQQIGPKLDAPGSPPGQPQLIDSVTAPDGATLYSVPSALNETFETPNSPRDFVHYQEGTDSSELTARGLTLARNPDPQDHTHGGQCLAVEVHFPLESGAWKNVDFTVAPDHPGCPVGPAAAVLFDVYVPPGMPGNIKAAFHLKDRHGAWFQAESWRRLVAGQWNTVLADLRPAQGVMRPVGNAAAYQQLFRDRSTGYGFSFYGDMPVTGVVFLDNIRVLAGVDELPEVIDGLVTALRAAKTPEEKTALQHDLQSLSAAETATRGLTGPPLAIANLSEACDDPPARLYEPREVQFDLTRSFDNPYDPDQIELWALVRKDGAPSLSVPATPPAPADVPLEHKDGFLVPAFYLQPAQSFNRFGADAYALSGPGHWAFRFTPTQTGPWSYALVVLDRRRLEAKLALSIQARLDASAEPGDHAKEGHGSNEASAADGGAARARRALARSIARELENHLRADLAQSVTTVSTPAGGAPTGLDRLAQLSRADLGPDRDARTRMMDLCDAALKTPELAWLKELLEKGAPPPPAPGAVGVTPAHFAAALLADTLLITAYRPLCDAQPAAPGNHGFVRVSRTDGRYFEFTDGAFFYPIGHNLRSPTDPRGAMILDIPETRDRGLNTYRDFFQKMRVNGENFCEVWMSSWFLDVEWTRRWQGYFGLTRMNQEHAARIDALLNLAQQYGIKLHFVLENHGKFSDWCDPEWDYSPYHEELQGGKLDPLDFFRDEEARAIYQKKLRYVIARFASHPAIAGIELVSEFDLTGTSGNANNPHGDRNAARQGVQAEWVKTMFDEIRRIDPYNHPLTNHYATGIAFIDWKSARDLFDYVVGDVYTDKNRNVSFLNHAIVFALKHREAMDGKLKPFLITEYGGDWSGASPTQLAGDLKSGIWSSWMTGSAGTPLLWWFDLIDKENLYTLYRPFALFIAGEDPRGQDLKARIYTMVSDLGYNKGLYAPNSAAPTGPDAERLDYIVRCDWSDKNGGDALTGYGWILDRENLSDFPFQADRRKDWKVYKEIKLAVSNFKPGEYAVEFWDTQSGQVIETRKLTVFDADKDGVPAKTLVIAFPDFKLDTAFKIKAWVAPVENTPAPAAATQPVQPQTQPSTGAAPVPERPAEGQRALTPAPTPAPK